LSSLRHKRSFDVEQSAKVETSNLGFANEKEPSGSSVEGFKDFFSLRDFYFEAQACEGKSCKLRE